MWPTSDRRGLPRLTAMVAAVSTVSLALTGLVVVGSATPASAAGVCATPGGSGAGGTLTGVVNSYYPGVGSAAPGATSISVGARTGSTTPIAAGDLLLVVQMQAADINSTNTNSYGHGPPAATPAAGYTALNAAGSYEYVLATSAVIAGSVGVTGLGTGAGLLNSYTSAAATGAAGQRTFQVIRVPQYTTATTSSTLTASAWNGSTGGVLALDTTSTLTLNGTVSVDGLGFRGGAAIQRTGATGLANTDVVTSATLGANGNKAEGIAGTPLGTTAGNGYPGGDAARGAPGNAGAGGTDGRPSANDENSGGGGGGNGAAGGQGGNTWNSTLDRGGYGGVVLPATSARVFLGGGGGAGTANNFAPPAAAGAAGGGMVLIRAGAVGGTGTITANGAAAYNLTQNDGGGGGGAGGTIVLTSPSGSLTGATLNATGGRGGNAWATQPGASSAHGPGGGGGGGWVLTSSAPTATSVAGGANGITTTGNLAYGAAPGGTGQTATATPASIPGVSGGAECADVSITKSGPATVAAGGAVAYQLTVANAGPAAATGLSVVDTLPAGVTFLSASGTGWTCTNSGNVSVTCTRASIASGGTAPVITVNVTAQAQAGTMVNSAAVTATTPDPVPANNTSSASTTVTARADLAITKSGPATVTAGANVTYSLVVQNLGPSDAASLSVVDTLPAGVTFVSASGGGWSCTNSGNVSVTCTRALLATGTTAPTISVVVTGPAQGATLSNSATVSSTTPDPVPGNNTSSVSTGVTASADLSVVKSGPASVVAGGSVSYSLVVANAGPSDAVAVSVVDTLPAGVVFVSASGSGWSCSNSGDVSVTCSRAAYAAGASTTITVVVTAPAQATSLSNTAAVSSTTADPVPGNNSSSAVTAVTASADLAVVKSGPASVVAGGSVSYSLAVLNLGPSDATSVSVVDTLPAGVVFGSASGPGWSCTNSGNVSVTCTRATFATGASNTITVVVTAPAQAATLSNAASISSATPDPVPGNNASSVSTTVTASADLSVVKSGPPTVTAAGTVTYALVVGNSGPSDAAAVSVVDTLPAGVTFVSAAGPGWSCTNSGNVSVTCTRATYAAGASTTITLVVTAPAQAATLTNTVSVASTTSDPDLTNNTSSVTTDVGASADLSVVKSGPASVVAGGSVSYSLVVANAGPSDAATVTVTDTLPSGVTFVSAAGPGWACTSSGNVSVTCTRATYATGASSTITIEVMAPAESASLTNSATVSAVTPDPVPGNNTSSVTTSVDASADLSVVKGGPATVTAAGAVSYSLLVANAGPSDATTVSVVDTLPADVTFGSASGPGWSCTNSGNVSVTCTRAAYVTGASTTITIVVTAPDQSATLTNAATVTSATDDPVPGNNTSSVLTTVTPSADLAVVKSAPATVSASGSISYVLTVSNAGPSDAASVSVVDTLPAGVTFVSAAGPGWTCTNSADVSVTCTRATYAVGASTTITIVVTAPGQPTTLVNSAAVSATTPDPAPGNNTSTASTTVTGLADLSIVKSGPPTVTAAGSVSYSLVVANAGPSDAVSVSVVDVLPAGVTFVSAGGTGWSCTNSGNVSVTCTAAVLGSGVTAQPISVVVTVPPQAVTLTNAVSVSSSITDPVPGNNTSSVTTDVTASADLSVVKAGPANVAAAGAVSYSLTVANSGPSDATTVTLVDTLPAGVTFVSAAGTGWSCTNDANVSVTCTRATYAAGASTTISIVVTAPAQATTLVNAATVSATTADPVPGNNTSTATTTVTASADLSVVKSAPATVVAGGSVSYSLVVANGGPSDASAVSVTDTLPPGVTFVSASGPGWSCTNSGDVSVTCTAATLAVGTSSTITIVVTAPAQAGSLVNSATVSATPADPVPGNNTSTASTTVTASADLSVVKSASATVVAGGVVSYSLAVANAGPSNASAVSVTDTLPAGVTFVSASGTGWSCTNAGDVSVTCTAATFAVGTSSTITIVVTAPAQPTTLVNAATVSATTPDPVPGNNTSTATTMVTASADLSVVKSAPATVVAGGSVSYSLLVANAGPSDATALSVTDTLPAGVTFVSASGTGWSCTNAGDVSVTCTAATLAVGTSSTITIIVTAPAQATTLVNSATVSATTPDPVPGNNTSTATTTVTASADLAISKSGPLAVTAGEPLTYTLTVTNNGPSDATAVTVTDTLPAGVTFVSAAGSGWSCTNDASVSVTCTQATYASGATTDISVVVTAPAQPGTLVNAAAVSAATPDPVPGNNTDDLTTTVGPNADLSLVKTGTATVTATGTVTYTLVAENLGPSDAVDVSVVDTLPPGVTFVSASGVGWLCSNTASVTVTCDTPLLASGASAAPIVVEVTAPSDAGVITNSATVSAPTPDPFLPNNTDTAPTTVVGSADLSLAKSGPTEVAAGGQITYTLAVANSGPSTAADVVVTDTLPPGVSFVSAAGSGWSCTNTGNVSVTCSRATLAVGPGATISVAVTAPGQGASLTNSAAVTASTPDPDPTDNDDSVATQVGAAADLSLVKTGPATVQVGQSVTYRLAVSNAGPDDAVDVTVTDTLPAGVTFVSAGGSGWTCTNAASTSVTCTRPGLADGTSAPDITVVVQAPPTAATLANNASVSATTFDPVDNNNASIASTGVLGQAIGGGGLPGTGGHGFAAVWLGLLLVALGTALRAVRRRPDRAL